ncbi:MAG: hypothetical protein V1718_04125 [archaeon]
MGMLELLSAMLKEEYRMRTAPFDRKFFFLYPVVVAFFSYFVSFSAMQSSLDMRALAVIVHLMFLVYGVSVGVFGLHAKDALNIRFDHLSLLLYSSRTLPLSPRVILLTFALQDVIYYFFLSILPVGVGIAFALLLGGFGAGYLLMMLVTFTLAFLWGISLSFFITMLYSRFRGVFLFSSLVFSYIAFVYYEAWFSADVIASLLLPVSLLSGFSADAFFIALFLPVALIFVALLLLSGEPVSASRRRGRDLFLPVYGYLFRVTRKYAPFVAKDLIDMHRTTGGVSKILFTYLIPAAMVWVMMNVFSKYFFVLNNTVMTFAIVVGVISTGIYNWLNQYDSLGNYRILPVPVRSVLVSKVISYTVISSFSSVAILFSVSYAAGKLDLLVLNLFLMFSVSFYVLSVLVYVAGLTPNIVLYDARVFVKYFAYCLPVLVALVTASFFPVESVFGVVAVMGVGAILMARWIFAKAIDKFDHNQAL